MAQLPGSRVELYAAIRRDARSGMSNRALQRKHGVGYRTVAAALESAWPKERKPPRNAAHVWTTSEASSTTGYGRTWTHPASLDTPRSGSSTGSSMSRMPPTCCTGWCASTSPPVDVRSGSRQAGNPRTRSSPRSTRPAAGPRPTSARWRSGYAGNWSPGTLFSLRLSYSGRVVHRISASAGQEAFFEGHAHAFRVLGGYVGDITSTIS